MTSFHRSSVLNKASATEKRFYKVIIIIQEGIVFFKIHLALKATNTNWDFTLGFYFKDGFSMKTKFSIKHINVTHWI